MNQSDEQEEAYNILAQRPIAPEDPPVEKLREGDDDQIITELNHPIIEPDIRLDISFYPSFIGKTWGEMKQMENNRENIRFVTSADIDPSLMALHARLQKYDDGQDHVRDAVYQDYEQRLETWRKNPSDTLRLPLLIVLKYGKLMLLPYDTLPLDVHSLEIFGGLGETVIPPSFAERKSLIALDVCASTLPAMPHIQILIWKIKNTRTNSSGISTYDFSKWTSLKILRLVDIDCEYNIQLPKNLISFTLHQKSNRLKERTVEEIFGDTVSIFRALRHIFLLNVNWPSLPVLDKCQYFQMSNCKLFQTIELPICKSFIADSCEMFKGFGAVTLANNRLLEIVVLHDLSQDKDTIIHLPEGSPFGYRHVSIYCTSVASLPRRFAPYAYISLIDAGHKHYINDLKVRETLEFYFDHIRSEYTNQCLPKRGETLKDMIERLYGFNWPKFITKLQRHYRFKKYMKNVHRSLVKSVGTPDICIHEVARLLGASKTFKCNIV